MQTSREVSDRSVSLINSLFSNEYYDNVEKKNAFEKYLCLFIFLDLANNYINCFGQNQLLYIIHMSSEKNVHVESEGIEGIVLR